MGNGCNAPCNAACNAPCNSRTNFTPRNIEEPTRYRQLSNNKIKESQNLTICSFNEYSSLHPKMVKSMPGSSDPRTDSRLENVINESEQEPYKKNLSLTYKKESDECMDSKLSLKSCQTTTSCNLRGVDIDTLSLDYCDSQISKKALDQIKQIEKELNTSDNDDRIIKSESNWREPNVCIPKENNQVIKNPVGCSPVTLSYEQRLKKSKLSLAKGRESGCRGSELEEHKYFSSISTPQKPQDRILKNNPFEEEIYKVVQCSPDKSSIPKLWKVQGQTQLKPNILDLEKSLAVNALKSSLSKTELSKTLQCSQDINSQSGGNEIQDFGNISQCKLAEADRFFAVLPPCYIYTLESSHVLEGSELSTCAPELGENKSSKNPFVEEEKGQDPTKKRMMHSSNKPYHDASRPNKKVLKPKIKKETWSWNKQPSSGFRSSSSLKYETVMSPTDNPRQTKKSIKHSLDSSNTNNGIEQKEDAIKAVSNWTVEDVLEWIMGLHKDLSQYIEGFKLSQIDGERLLVLTVHDLARFIPNERHRFMVMNTLDKICPTPNELSLESMSGSVKRYKLIKLIKIGMFSTTHLARDLENGKRMCAVKLMSSEKIKNLLPYPQLATRELALKVLLHNRTSLQHKNMIAYYGHFAEAEYRGALYDYVVVREHHPLNLWLLIKNGIALGENISRSVLHQLVSLLRFLRSIKIGHFDLQPCNLLVKNDDWQIKVTDWSSFKMFKHQSTFSDGQLNIDNRGMWMAPEIYNCSKYGLAADSWSLGVVLFGLITGTLLFSSRSESDTAYNAMKRDNYNDFCESMEENTSSSLMDITKTLIFSLVKYNAEERLDIEKIEDYKYYTEALPTAEQYTSAMESAFAQILVSCEV